MSYDESQGIGASPTRDSSEMDFDTDGFPSSHDVRRLNTDIETAEKETSKGLQKMKHELQKMRGPAFGLVTSLSERKEKKPIDHSSEEKIKMAASSPKTILSRSQLQENPHSSNVSTPETKKDDHLCPSSKPGEKADGSSSNLKPPYYKDIHVSDSDLLLTKEKLAESLSLEEACGLLPILMKSKRLYLKGKENQLDQISVDMLTALHDAKNVCILMGNVPEDVPQDISAARVQAQKLLYLLSSTSRIFETLSRLGNSLLENIHAYASESEDYHSNVDILLEYIMEKIIEKLRKISKKN